MALPLNPLRKDIALGVAIGIGIGVLVPVVALTLAPALRPALRSSLKGAIRVYEQGRESVAELGEQFEDIVAEVQTELRSQRNAGAAAAGADVADQGGGPDPARDDA